MSHRLAWLALTLSLLPTITTAQPAFQVADLGKRLGDSFRSPLYAFTPPTQAGGRVFFGFFDETRGIELWVSDGSGAGTSPVTDLCPGACSSFPSDLVAVGPLLYFSANDGDTNILFRTDGTAAGTVSVFPPYSALGLKQFLPFAELGGRLLLLSDNRASGQVELWVSDGTASGTSLIQPLGPIPPPTGSADGSGPQPLGHLGALVVFSNDNGDRNDPLTHGRSLWKTDGTPQGTGLLARVEPVLPTLVDLGSGGARDLPVVTGALLFSGCTLFDCRLYRTDGTSAGTRIVTDFALHAGIPTAWNGVAVFRGSDPNTSEDALWKTDGTSTGTVRIAPPPGSSLTPMKIAAAGPRLVFSATDTLNGSRMWQSDGTAAGTVPLQPLLTPSTNLSAAGGKVVFLADDGSHGPEPWVSDGTASGTRLLADIVPGPQGSIPNSDPFSPHVFPIADHWLLVPTNPTWQLWGSDGTPAGTARLKAVDPYVDVLVDPFLDLGSAALFATPTLWRTDGTAAGTRQLGVLASGSTLTRFGDAAYFSFSQNLSRTDGTAGGTSVIWTSQNGPGELTVLGDRLYFLEIPGGLTVRLYATDGTPAGTHPLSDAIPVGISGQTRMVAAGRHLFFTANQASAGDLWVSDGTAAGTAPLVLPGQTASLFTPSLLTAVGSRLFFVARGTELWVTDGTGAGAAELGSFSSIIGTATAGDRFFFVADDGLHGSELWGSDGTPGGTHLVADIFPGALGAFDKTPPPQNSFVPPIPLTVLFDRLYFAANDGVHGNELWTSDGTAAGTHLVADLLPGTGSSRPTNLTAIGHLLFFSATDGVHGAELWQSDGTAAGTRMVQDLAPGDLSSNPAGFAASGPYIYFAATDGADSYQPWALPRASLGGFLTATLTVAGQTLEGGTVTYTLTVTNIGAGPVLDNLGDEVADVLPASFTLLSATAGSGAVTLDLPGNRVAWNGALDPGASVTITIQARVGAGTFGTSLANQATLAFDADGNGSNESSGVSDDPGRPGAADATTFSPATAALGFYTLPPCRAVDTRGGTPLAGGTARTVALAGTCGIPAGARAVAGNFTVVNPTAAGFLTVFPTGTPAPLTSTLNFSRGQTRTNNAVFALSGGKLDAKAGLLGGGQLDLVLDVVGYFQ